MNTSVEGYIIFESGLPASDIPIKLYNKEFGGAGTQIGSSTTDKQGFYKVSYDSNNGKSTNCGVRAIDKQGKEIVLSDTKFSTNESLVLNLVAPEIIRPLVAEYPKIASDIEKQLGGDMKKLIHAHEKGEDRQDISLLHHATGWEGRLIAPLATAVKIGVDTDLPSEAVYALLRVGLPSQKEMLAAVKIPIVQEALNKAKTAKIVGPDFSLEEAMEAFENFAGQIIPQINAPGTLSSVAEFLDKSGLSDDDNNSRSKFENLYFNHSGASEELWTKAVEQGIPQEKVEGLRLQGKLAHLTLNNAELTDVLQKEKFIYH